MTKTRRIFLLVTGVSTVMGIVAACTFPEPRIIDATADGGGTEGGGEDVTTDQTGGEDVAVKDAVSEGVDFDGPPPIDATSEKPFVNEAGCFCDCDKDGYRTIDQDAAACGDAAVSKTQFDCDDLDKRAHPNADFVTDLPTQDTKGDWNCDTKYTLQYPPGFKCSEFQTALGTGCEDHQGFTAPEVNCGQESVTWIQCQNPGAVGACTPGGAQKVTQGCK